MTGCCTRKPGVVALLLLRLDLGRLVPWCWHSAMKAATSPSCPAIALASGWSGASAHEARAEQRVGPRSEHLDRCSWPAAVLRFAISKRISRPSRAADPVRLHQAHLLRPAVELSKRVEQVFRVVGDLENPFRLLALLDERAGTPAPAVDHLLVGEYRVVNRVPVHLALLAVDQPGLAACRGTGAAAGGNSRGRRSRARATSRSRVPST